MNVINCTPHEINLLTESENIVYPPSGIVTRVNVTSVMEATSPQVPLECSECHQMTGGPA